MKKRIFIFTLIVFINSILFSQTNDKIRINVPSFSDEGTISETTYVKEYPKSYTEAIEMIDLLIEIYGDVSNNYKDQIDELVNMTKEIEKELKLAQEKNKTLENIDKANNNIDVNSEKENKIFKDYFESFGIIGEYGVINGSNELSLQFGIKLWKFSFSAGPNILLQSSNNNKIDFGFRGSIGIWF